MSTDDARFAAHNERQRAYFSRATKRTMIPRDTPYLRRHVDELARFARLEEGARILEVGCGMGRYTLLLARRGYRVEGLDLTPELLDALHAANREGPAVSTWCGDIAAPPPGLVGGFDAAIGFFTLHHMHDVAAAFSSMASLVRPGGRVAFVEPNPFNPLYYVQIALTPGMTWEGDRGIVRMTRSRLFAALREAGLVEPEIHRFGVFPPAIANRKWAGPLERVLERFPPWRFALPFQLVGARRP